MYDLPGLFCWYGAASLIPIRYTNLRILHQIWCLKHEFRMAKKNENGDKIYPKTSKVMELWHFSFNSKIISDERRMNILKSGFGCHSDVKTSCLRSKYKLKQGTKTIPFEESDLINKTLSRLERRNPSHDGFYRFYKKNSSIQ